MRAAPLFRIALGVVAAFAGLAAGRAEAPPRMDPALAGHARLQRFLERSEADDSYTRSDIDGTKFQANARILYFIIMLDLPAAKVPKPADVRCVAVHRGGPIIPFEITLNEEGGVPGSYYSGRAGSDRPGWAPGDYRFGCFTRAGAIAVHEFHVG